MSALTLDLQALCTQLSLALGVWALATTRRNAAIVDVFWPLFFVAGAAVHAFGLETLSLRAMLVLALLVAWAARLSLYLTIRNWGAPEDRRYQAIRARNEPGYAWKSLYLVFGLQAVLAWIVGMPVSAALGSDGDLAPLDFLGAGLVAFGVVFQAIADAQLARFKADPTNAHGVMERGLWRYSRHPNYFAEFCVWWGFYLLAVSAGAWWSLPGPVLMTVLLLKVSGVGLLEKDIGERRPAYQDYIARTNAFFPGPPKSR